MANVALTAAATLAESGRERVASALGIGVLKHNQLEVLQGLVAKHVVDPTLAEIANTEDFAITSLERGVLRYEHAHLVAALDVILTYQQDRRAKGCGFIAIRKSYRHDPRTRLCELLKRWLRANAATSSVSEVEVRRMCSLCRDILNYPRMFPSRNPRSFTRTMAEVLNHMQLQLKEVLTRDRSCAELVAGALSASRNLIADGIAYMLVAATDLKQTDRLPSLEVVALWRSLPIERSPLPGLADAELQRLMSAPWKTLCGSLVAALLAAPWTLRLFGGVGAQDEAAPAAPAGARGSAPLAIAQGGAHGGTCRARSQPPITRGAQGPRSSRLLRAGSWGAPGRARSASPRRGGGGGGERLPDSLAGLLSHVEGQFGKGCFGNSGLAGPFRGSSGGGFRSDYLFAIRAIDELMYLFGVVLVHFQRISEGLGDYGMIRVAPSLHPFLEELASKVQVLEGHLVAVNEAVDQELVIAKARGRKVKTPAPTECMSTRAHASINRAVVGRESHASSLLRLLEDLKSRSAPERLPALVDDLGDACAQLEGVLFSSEFRSRVGDEFPELPPLREAQAAVAGGGPAGEPAAVALSHVSIEGLGP